MIAEKQLAGMMSGGFGCDQEVLAIDDLRIVHAGIADFDLRKRVWRMIAERVREPQDLGLRDARAKDQERHESE
jgi:hypothetical protein